MGLFKKIAKGIGRVTKAVVDPLDISGKLLGGGSRGGSASIPRMSEEDRKKKEAEAAATGRANLKADGDAGAAMGREVIGGGLGRLEGQQGIEDVRSLMQQQAGGTDSTIMEAQRESALEQLNAGQQTAQRGLQSSLAASGVKGGAAGAQLARLQSQGINARRGLERDLIGDQAGRQSGAINNLASFETKTSQFDLAQAAKEKNIDIQARLGYAELGSAERSSVRMSEAASLAAAAAKQGRGGKK